MPNTQKPADKLMSDLALALESHRKATSKDEELAELHKVAESALEMLMVIRQCQIERASRQSS